MIFMFLLLTISDFGLRQISGMVSDILCVGGGINDGLELRDNRFELEPKIVLK